VPYKIMDTREENVRGIRQALFWISGRQPVPASNPLLHSPLVLSQLEQQNRADTPDNRQEVLEELLRELVNAYGLEEPEEKRQQERHSRIFEVLFAKLNGKDRPANMPDGTYERYHALAIKVLAQRFQEAEDRFLHGNDVPDALWMARHKAMDLVKLMDENLARLDLFLLSALTEQAAVIANHDYYAEAATYFARVHHFYLMGPENKIWLTRRMDVTTWLAHCAMNFGDIAHANGYFQNVTALAKRLEDWENVIHGTHMQGVTYSIMDRADWALDCFDEATFYIHLGHNPQHREGWLQRDIVAALTRAKRFDPIPNLARQSLKLREHVGDTNGCMMTLEAWAGAEIEQQRFRHAERRLIEARAIFTDIPPTYQLARAQVLETSARLYWAWGKREQGRPFLEQARAIAR
jgi:hypothetical protein